MNHAHDKTKCEGWVIWFTGLSGSGKTTLSMALKERLWKETGVNAVMLDGDSVRSFFDGDLGYSRAERIMNVRRIAFAAQMLAQCGHLVLAANIAPYYEVRDFLRLKIPKYFQVYCKTTLAAVIARDTKKHYQNYAEGRTGQLIGLDDAYDEPRRPDVVLDTSDQPVDACLDQLWNALKERGIV